MRSCVKINGENERVLIKLKEEATQEEIMDSLKKKLTELKKLYKEENNPIFIFFYKKSLCEQWSTQCSATKNINFCLTISINHYLVTFQLLTSYFKPQIYLRFFSA